MAQKHGRTPRRREEPGAGWAAGSVRKRRDEPGEFGKGVVAPEGTVGLKAGGDGLPQLWRVNDGQLLASFGDAKGNLGTVKFCEDGRVVLTLGLHGEEGEALIRKAMQERTGFKLRIWSR